MKKAFLLACLFALAAALGAQGRGQRILFVYDEVNYNSKPYISLFESALASEGLPFDAAKASEARGKDLAAYDLVLVHGMVMAFTSKSPVRDWLKSDPRLEGKKVALFVTANRWYLDKLFSQLKELLGKDKANLVDAVSMATKGLDGKAKESAVRAFVGKLK
jgi:hypothetical protein